MRRPIYWLLMAFAAVASGPASAGLIDFTTGAWSGANGQGSFTHGNVRVSTNVGKLTQGSHGLGISSSKLDHFIGLDDEIDEALLFDEALTVDFLNPGGQHVRQISLLNLFDDWLVGPESYTIEAYLAGGGSQTFTGTVPLPTQPGGLLVLDLPGTFGRIDKLEFTVPNYFSDYSVTAIVTPLPAALWLFGTAIGGLFFTARRRRRTAC